MALVRVAVDVRTATYSPHDPLWGQDRKRREEVEEDIGLKKFIELKWVVFPLSGHRSGGQQEASVRGGGGQMIPKYLCTAGDGGERNGALAFLGAQMAHSMLVIACVSDRPNNKPSDRGNDFWLSTLLDPQLPFKKWWAFFTPAERDEESQNNVL
ncbi:unnamed protein product [Staurois parvus]|uniref:Uncharacterized protein n=1 Tax=Staurois parvus TaxID=386267 RepID=A0ABN9ECE5_9NEOB|nr:unnamed protein product [Staurois parvus]